MSAGDPPGCNIGEMTNVRYGILSIQRGKIYGASSLMGEECLFVFMPHSKAEQFAADITAYIPYMKVGSYTTITFEELRRIITEEKLTPYLNPTLEILSAGDQMLTSIVGTTHKEHQPT